MRWKVKVKRYPQNGDLKYVKKFLWLPLIIGSDCRWLEFAFIKKKYHDQSDISPGYSFWENIEFANIQQKIFDRLTNDLR